MPKRRLFWHLLPSYVLLAAGALLAVGWMAVARFEQALVDATRADLQARADFLDAQLGADAPGDRQDFAKLSRRFRQTSAVRIWLLLPSGQATADALDAPEELENPLDRKEVRQALSGTASTEVRYNAALDQRVLYLAVPVFRNDRLFRILYLSTPLAFSDQTLWQMRADLLPVGLVIAAGAVLVARWVAGTLARPLEEMRRAADRLADGRWNARAPVADARELAELAERFNAMADRLQQRIGVLIQNTNEQKAVLASMAEGVLAVDNQERVISLNTASSQLLGIDPSQVQGRRLQEVMRNADLSRFISRALAVREPTEADVLLHGDRERTMQARGSSLHDLEGRPIGVVVVLNDVTDFRRLEHIRRDFVANVSHELKTPVTSIKGFVETLLDGAMKDPDAAERFLRIVAKQADRSLHAIIEDLLALSKIEQSEEGDIVLEPKPIRPVIESALHTCQTGAKEREIEVIVDCQDGLQARINSVLLEQAVVNLLDNAIKYSEPGRQVRIVAAENNGEVMIRVTDRGAGIANQYLARIFERFYRVDPARSRKLGGTGLGLAIVKHIVQAHHGRVAVESTLGAGSTFTIALPRIS